MWLKILIITGGFFPGKKYGGPPVSINNFCTLVNDVFDCYIVTTNHDLHEKEKYNNIIEGWNDKGNCKVLYLSDSLYKKSSFEKVIKDIKPDLLYLQGLFQSCVLPCLILAKKYKLKVLLAPRGELCEGAMMKNRKKYKKTVYINALKMMGLFKDIHFQTTSEEEIEDIKNWITNNDDRIHLLDNIPSLPEKECKRKNKYVTQARFIFLSRINPKKNLLAAIKFFADIKGNVVFDIFGPIEDRTYWNQCQQFINRLPENIKVSYKGLVEHNQVHNIFSQYDAFIFPTYSENYGHVIAESLLAGTPVIISDQTPWKGLMSEGAGWDIPLKNKKGFINAINTIVDSDTKESERFVQCAHKYILKRLSIEGLKNQYITAFNTIITHRKE